MRYSTKVSDAVHILALIAMNPYGELTSQAIATSVHTNPGFVRQIMTALKKGGLVTSVTGHAKPALARETKEISLLDIYKAVQGDKPLLHLDTHTNPECGVGVGIQYALKQYYDEVQTVAEAKMAKITLKNLIDTYEKNQKIGIDFTEFLNMENHNER